MPYNISWLVEGRVILAELTGEVSVEEFRSYDRTMCKHLDDAAAPQAHYLVNTSQLESVPDLNDTKEFAFLKHPHLGWTAAVGTFDPLVRLVGNLMSKVYKMRTRELKSLEEAFDFLQQADTTLPDLRAALKGTDISSQFLTLRVETTPPRVAPTSRRATTRRLRSRTP
jgi:hypothetical protein